MMERHLGHEVMEMAADINRIGTGDDIILSANQLKTHREICRLFNQPHLSATSHNASPPASNSFEYFKIYHSFTLITTA
jgi:hypothetical protein